MRNYLRDHQVVTAYEIGWSELSNGELIARAEEQFDVLVTTDKSLRYQQNLTRREIAILILPDANWLKLEPHAAKIAAAVLTMQPRGYVELDLN